MTYTEQFLMCTHNVFSDSQHPTYALTATEQAAGYEVWHVGTGRRHPLNRWQPTTTNSSNSIYADAGSGVSVAASFLAIDRESNILGQTVTLSHSANFSSWTTVVNATVPASAGGVPTDANGCVTSEGAWIKSFASASDRYWRVTFAAMGVGLVPQITHLMVGQAFEPTDLIVELPMEDDTYSVGFTETKSSYGWKGRGRIIKPRQGTVHLRPVSTSYDAQIRSDILGYYAAGYPAWLVWQKTDRPTAAVLAHCVPGQLSYPMSATSQFRTLDLPYEEEQPLLP